jgi:hypothetical protein
MPHDGTGYWFHEKYYYGGKWFVGCYEWSPYLQHRFFVLADKKTGLEFKRYFSYHEAKKDGWYKK